ncbi:MAG: rhamnulokinase family protein [Planctomycetota bacterium]
MAGEKNYIAVDLGADSSRVMLGVVSAEKLRLEEVHRFKNGPVEQDGSLRWDFGKLLAEVKAGIGKAAKQAGGEVAGIGVDSWGVDFGLLDEKGELIENPYHYRDSRTNGMMEKAFELMPKREIYENTGIQFMQLNTIYQLFSTRLANSPVLAKAKKLVFIADLVSYLLCGKSYAEYTLASSSQLMDMRTGKWSQEVFKKLNLPIEIMPEVVLPGTVVGTLTNEVAEEIGCTRIPVIAAGSHDTASAVVAVPADEQTEWAYLSSGTWSVMGVEILKAIVNEKTFEHQLTNEGGVEGTIRLLTNIMGMWPVQECKRQWQKEGEDLSYAQLTAMAEKAGAFAASVNINDGRFLAPGDMPRRINAYLAETKQQEIKDKGQMMRVLLESLALKYRETLNGLEEVVAKEIDVLHIVGGGSQNELLNQFAADATGKEVITGPVEATAIGNILMQALATGQIESVSQGRGLVRKAFALKQYQPKETAAWERQYKKTQKFAQAGQ